MAVKGLVINDVVSNSKNPSGSNGLFVTIEKTIISSPRGNADRISLIIGFYENEAQYDAGDGQVQVFLPRRVELVRSDLSGMTEQDFYNALVTKMTDTQGAFKLTDVQIVNLV
jgi:hypothetical protein